MLYPLLRPLIFRLDAERAHRLSILALQLGPVAPPPASTQSGEYLVRQTKTVESSGASGVARRGCPVVAS